MGGSGRKIGRQHRHDNNRGKLRLGIATSEGAWLTLVPDLLNVGIYCPLIPD